MANRQIKYKGILSKNTNGRYVYNFARFSGSSVFRR